MAKCGRCGKETNVTIMSWFNTQEICMECSDEEEKDPRVEKAKEADRQAIRQGNYNFTGIGF